MKFSLIANQFLRIYNPEGYRVFEITCPNCWGDFFVTIEVRTNLPKGYVVATSKFLVVQEEEEDVLDLDKMTLTVILSTRNGDFEQTFRLSDKDPFSPF